ncbi:hypothetical protein DY000_02021821 [Brassica cretica]|uniref:Uncharacterized protein n=1 Tax=Brassica cretica TaxID=69181 RepID=A0ABQ7EF90_BRACR|nr:hypothetical protein DY000_02021821 [Brassica cretica]
MRNSQKNILTHPPLLFSEDPAHLERTIRKDQRSTSLDAAAFTSTDSHTQPSTDTRPSSSTDLHRSTSIDTTPRTSIDHQSRNMVAIVILRQDENGNLYDQDGHLRNATVVKHEKLGGGEFEVERSMNFGGSHWCRPTSMDTHRSTDHDEDRSTDCSKHLSASFAKSTAECSAVRIMTHEEFAEKHPHPPSPFYVKIDRPHEPAVDRQRETNIDRPPSPPIDRRAPLTYRVRLPSIDNDRINALRPPPKPLANPPEPTTNPSDTTPEPLQHEKLGEGDFEVESSMSFGGSHWCRPMSMDTHRSTDHDEDRLTDYTKNRSTSSAESTAECSTVRIMTHEEFAEKHPHPPSPFYVKIDRPHEPAVDRQRETDIDRPPSPRSTGTYHLPNDDFWQVVKHEKLGEGDLEVESSMSFGGSHWCRPMSMDTHRSTDHDEDRSTDYSKHRSTSSAESTAECCAVRIMIHEEFTEKHPHPPSPFYVKIDRPHEPAVDRQRETEIDQPPSPPIDRRAPLTYRVRLPSIDNDRINALRPPPKPLANPPEPTTNPSDTTPEPMQVDEETEGRRLRKRKEKIPKYLKREANEKEMDGFTKRVLRIPVEKPFDEVYFTHRLWMFFRETKETEEDIRRMFHHVREMMKLRITLEKKSDPGKFAIPSVVKGQKEVDRTWWQPPLRLNSWKPVQS